MSRVKLTWLVCVGALAPLGLCLWRIGVGISIDSDGRNTAARAHPWLILGQAALALVAFGAVLSLADAVAYDLPRRNLAARAGLATACLLGALGIFAVPGLEDWGGYEG